RRWGAGGGARDGGGPRAAGGGEAGAPPSRRKNLVEEGGEGAEVGLPPVAARALALLDDQLDGGPGGSQVGDRHQLRPAEHLAARLRVGRADEHARLAMAADQPRETVLDAAGPMADRGVCLPA